MQPLFSHYLAQGKYWLAPSLCHGGGQISRFIKTHMHLFRKKSSAETIGIMIRKNWYLFHEVSWRAMCIFTLIKTLVTFPDSLQRHTLSPLLSSHPTICITTPTTITQFCTWVHKEYLMWVFRVLHFMNNPSQRASWTPVGIVRQSYPCPEFHDWRCKQALCHGKQFWPTAGRPEA